MEAVTPWPLGPYARCLSCPRTTLLVGPDAIAFHVPQLLLMQLPFFRAALNGPYLESTTNTVSLPDDDPEVFSKLVEVLSYIPPLSTTPSKAAGSPTPPTPVPTYSLPLVAIMTPQTDQSQLLTRLFHSQVYILAEKYACQPLLHAAAQYIRASTLPTRKLVLEYLILVYEMSGEGSGLRLLRSDCPHSWGGLAIKHFLRNVWMADGGVKGARMGGGLLEEVCRRAPELMRDLVGLLVMSDD
ncbi:hypothetical protein BDZ91DRAFT_717370, partial [Kalaharituber pfeilii]